MRWPPAGAGGDASDTEVGGGSTGSGGGGGGGVNAGLVAVGGVAVTVLGASGRSARRNSMTANVIAAIDIHQVVETDDNVLGEQLPPLLRLAVIK